MLLHASLSLILIQLFTNPLFIYILLSSLNERALMSQLKKTFSLPFILFCTISAKLTFGTVTIAPGDKIDFDVLHTHQKIMSKPEFILFNNDELSLNAPVQLFETPSQPFLVYDREDHLGLNSLPESLKDTLLYESIPNYRGHDSFIGIFPGFSDKERMIIRTDRGLTAVMRFSELHPAENFDFQNPAYDSLNIEYWIGEKGDFEKITSTCFIDLTRDNEGEVPGLEWNRIHFSDGTVLDAFDQQREDALYYSILSGWSGNRTLFTSADPADTLWHECRELPHARRDVDTITSFVTDLETGDVSATETAVMLLYETAGDELPTLFTNYSPAVYRDIFFTESDERAFKFQIDSIITDTSWGPSNNQQVDIIGYKLKWAVSRNDSDLFPASAVPVEPVVSGGVRKAKPLALVVQENGITLSRALDRATIELFSVSGRRLFTGAVQGESIHLPAFSTGIYHYRISTLTDSYRGNILIQ